MKELFYNIDTVALQAPSSQVVKLGATEFLSFGNDNKYLTHLRDLFLNVPVLRTLVEGSALLSAGLFEYQGVFDFEKMFRYLYLYGSCPILVRRSRDKKSYHLTAIDPRYVRTNEDSSKYAYSEQESFRKKIEYPAYSPMVEGSSILMVNLNDLAYPYSMPLWSSALKEVQILSKVSEYHNASLENGFTGSYLINFNNGTPSPEDKEQIERLINSKFSGTQNAGRVMVAFNDSKDSEATLQSLSTEDTSTRYGDLVRACKEALYTSFRGSSQLFGAPDGSETALNATEFSYKLTLFTKFTIAPIARRVYKTLAMFGVSMGDPMSIIDSVVEHSEGE